MMKAGQINVGNRDVMKLQTIGNQALIEAIKKVQANPGIGDEKKGVLKGIYLYKLNINNLSYLLSYRIREGLIEVVTFGPYDKYFKNRSEDF